LLKEQNGVAKLGHHYLINDLTLGYGLQTRNSLFSFSGTDCISDPVFKKIQELHKFVLGRIDYH